MYLLGYDIGSSSVKGALLEVSTGKRIASDHFPKSEAPIKALKHGWAEQDPNSWIEAMQKVTASIIAQSGIKKSDIKAIGISYQMHGLVAVDKAGIPVRDSIIWCDSRAVNIGEETYAKIGKEKCLKTILNSPGNFTASKLAWVQRNEPELYDRIYKIMLPGDYAAYKLTGEITTTPGGLSEGMLWDFKSQQPAWFLMDHLGFDRRLLPTLVPTFGIQGYVDEEGAKTFGLEVGTPVTYRAGDQPNNALSLNVFHPGEIASTAGTSGVIYGVMDTIAYDPKGRVNNFTHVNNTPESLRIGVLACINGTGSMNSWIRRNIAPANISYQEMNLLAEEIPAGSEGLTVLPFGNGAERLLSNSLPGCCIEGINFNLHDRRHIIRASQEGVAFSFCLGLEIMREMGLKASMIHAGNANMYLSPIFRQTIADVSGVTILRYDTDGADGAAKGAGLGAGIYSDTQEAFSSLQLLGETAPMKDNEQINSAYSLWRKRLENQLQIL